MDEKLAVGRINLDACETLRWGDRVPGFVRTIVIDHVVLTNPMVSSGLNWAERLV